MDDCYLLCFKNAYYLKFTLVYLLVKGVFENVIKDKQG